MLQGNRGGKLAANLAETQASLAKLIPDDIRQILGKPPLIRGEDPQAYDQLFSQIVVECQPQAMSDWFRAKDVTDAAWEALRLRRMTASVVDLGIRQVGKKLLQPLMSKNAGEEVAAVGKRTDELLAAYISGREEAVQQIEGTLTKVGLDEADLTAAAFEAKLDPLGKLDRMVETRIKQRDRALHDLARAAEARAARPMVDSGAIEDVEVDHKG
jgi:hypothetical protein